MPASIGGTWYSAFGATLADDDMKWPKHADGSLFQFFKIPTVEQCLLQPLKGRARVAPIVFRQPGVLRLVDGSKAIVGTRHAAGDHLALSVTLFGQAEIFVDSVVQAIAKAAERGIGTNDAAKRRGTAVLEQVRWFFKDGMMRETAHHSGGFDLSGMKSHVPQFNRVEQDIVTLILLEPLRIERHGGNQNSSFSVLPEDLKPAEIVKRLVNRISDLTACHCGVALPEHDLDFMLKDLPVRSSSIFYCEQTHYSRKINEVRDLGGLMGYVQFDISKHKWLIPYFQLGKFVGIGSRAAMGQGAVDFV